MTIGAGIFLMAVGAILAFAVHVSISGLNIAVIGVILMVAGAIGIALDLTVFSRRRRVAGLEPRIGPTGDPYGEGPLGEGVVVDGGLVKEEDLVEEVPAEEMTIARVPVDEVYEEAAVPAAGRRRYRRARTTAHTEEYPPRAR